MLEQLGRFLDEERDGEKLRDRLIGGLLKIRPRKGWPRSLRLNRAQARVFGAMQAKKYCAEGEAGRDYDVHCGAIFIQTITKPGTLTVQVAHDDESGEAIFNIVQRYWEHLPKELQRGALVKSRSNTRQIVFPRLDSEYRVETADANAGRGMTIHNLHCSEVSRWPRGGEDTLASLRAAVVPEGEIVLESTPRGASGLFYEEWTTAEERGYTKHFFPGGSSRRTSWKRWKGRSIHYRRKKRSW